MAFRFLIYSTGTTFADTIVRESATDNPGALEASEWSDFVIPEIQPLYLWRVTGGTDVVPNIDSNINAYLEDIAPPPKAEDDATVGFVTGITENKIDTVTGVTGNLGTFTADGNLEDGGYTIPELTGLTTYTFVGSGGTQVFEDGNEITVYSTPPTGSTVAWGDITGTLSNQTDLQDALNLKLDIADFTGYTATTETRLEGIEDDITGLTATVDGKLDTSVFTGYTGTTQPIIDAALTGATSGGSGTTLITSVADRVITLKSISVLGGLTLSGDADNIILSGQTGGTGGGSWGTITGTLSDQTDLWFTLTGMTAETATKLDTAVFTGYTATTETRLEGIEDDITGLTATKLDISTFSGYTGTTQPIIDAALTGATNGLTANGRDVELGGTLTKDTTISGITNAFTINTSSIILQSAGVNGIELIDTAGSDIYIESDGGAIELIGNTSGSVEVTKLSISETAMTITDGRGTPVGLEYAADYSTTFTDESLITKRYADSIAAGLIPKAAVLVATTGNSGLSGLTTIDGVTLSNGDRVLVKDNTDASENGIYIATGGTWSRSTDFDGNPDGEVSAGNIIPVLSGDTLYSTLWVLITPNPITVGTTDLEFTLFSEPHALIPGVGISINGNVIAVDGASLAGSSIAWTGDTFNVDTTTGNVATALALKLDVSDFNSYSGTTETRLEGIEGDITGLTATKLDIDVFTGYTATTETRLEGIEDDITGLTATKLDTTVFTGYTASTVSNEIFLTHTGGTNLNTILATAIDWDTAEISGSSFIWSGDSNIGIVEGGDYEVNYNIPYNIAANSSIGVGANVILNNSIVIDVTAAAGLATRNKGAGSVGLPTVILSLSANDILTLATFRTHQSGTATSSLTGSILIKKKNTLQ